MRLNRLFNVKYLLQNIKKSKMTLALFLVVVPIFTSLMIIAADDYTFEFASLASINIMGMYLVPFMISICLFGYVYKKNSVDFMGSMPISRKAIFVTNTVGGITLIILMQLVTFFLTLLIGSLTKGIVFTSMAWDIFLYQTIAYIFVFVVANLAMSLSGTLVTQIAVTMLILFLVPFSTWFVNGIARGYHDYTLMNQDIKITSLAKAENYTAPFYLANGTYEFNTISLVKMLVLTIVYFALGYWLFTRKKMEVAGESFENKYAHFVVKGLTLVPFIAMLRATSEFSELALTAIFLTIIFVYYIVFDLMTSKKIKLWENVIGVVVSVAMIYGFYSIAIHITENMERKVSFASVKELDVDFDSYFHTSITGKDKMLASLTKLVKSSNSYNGNESKYRVKVTVKTQSGAKYYDYCYATKNVLSEIMDDKTESNHFGKEVAISNKQMVLSKQEQQKIIQSINASLKDLQVNDLINANRNYINLHLTEYRNHELIEVAYPITLNPEIQKMVMMAYNRYAAEYIKSSGVIYDDYTINSFEKFEEDTKRKVWFALSRNDSREKIDAFILSHEDEKPENVQNCVMIYNYHYSFYTSRIEELLSVIEQIYKEHQEEWEDYLKYEVEDDYYQDKYYNNPTSFPQTSSSYDGIMIDEIPMQENVAISEEEVVELSGEQME